jgi:hypothetical protein
MFWCKLVFSINKNGVELEHECQSFLIPSDDQNDALKQLKMIANGVETNFVNENGDLMSWKFIGIHRFLQLSLDSNPLHLCTDYIQLNHYQIETLTPIS